MNALAVGFYGKLPELGDFVQRALRSDFISVWDQWAQQCLDTSRAALGDEWLDAYLTSPLWRFALPSGLAGPHCYAGVMVPSVDSVGRYFPLTIAAALSDHALPLPALLDNVRWFQQVEAIVHGVLDSQITDPDALASALGETRTLLRATMDPPLRQQPSVVNGRPILLASDRPSPLTVGAGAVVDRALSTLCGPTSYWCTSGSERMGSRLIAVPGLPSPESFAGMLIAAQHADDWLRWGSGEDPAVPEAAWHFDAAVRSETGKIRSANEDAAMCDSVAGVWAVADGMGGHRDGAIASAAIRDALADVDGDAEIGTRIGAVIARLNKVNRLLRAAVAPGSNEIASAATVVVLLVAAGEFACLWAGDARLYRYRNDTLQQIGRDHSVGLRDGPATAETYYVTGGIGVADECCLESIVGTVLAGDRFLLCSDGVHASLPEAELKQLLQLETAQAAVDAVSDAVLAGEARDNLTALVVDVQQPT